MQRSQDYPVTKNADGWTDRRTDNFSALYGRLATCPIMQGVDSVAKSNA